MTHLGRKLYVFGIAGHENGEVDNVRGMTEVRVCREIAAGKSILDSPVMENFFVKGLKIVVLHTVSEKCLVYQMT